MISVKKYLLSLLAVALLGTAAWAQPATGTPQPTTGAQPKPADEKKEEPKPTGPPAAVAGEWDWTIAVPDNPLPLVVTLKQEGEKITGTIKSALGETAIDNGKVAGDRLSFSINVQVGGDQIVAKFNGTVTGEDIKGTVEVPMGVIDFKGSRKKATAATGTTPAPATGAAAAGVAGQWDIVVAIPDGPLPVTVHLKQTGEEISGTSTSRLGNADITKGKLTGNKITFTINVNYQGQLIPATYVGTIEGDSMKGVVETPLGSVDFTGKKAAAGAGSNK